MTSKGSKFPVEILTAVEVRALVRACSVRSHTGIRNAALVGVMYRAGLRVGEALALRPKDYDDGKVTAVLHEPPVDSPLAAVRAAIREEYRR